MRLWISAGIVCLAIGVSACSRAGEDDRVSTEVDESALNADADLGPMESNIAAPAPQSATDFASMIASGDMYEIEAGKLAQTKASTAALKNFGGVLVTQHTQSSTELKAAAAASVPPVTLPTALSAEHQAQVDALKAAQGEEFDRLFKQQQIAAHEKARDTLKAYSENGDSRRLKAFASKAVGIVQDHLDQLNAMTK